jgi:hypothetical protein
MKQMKYGILTLGDNLADPNTGTTTSVDRRYRQIVDLAVRAEEFGFDGFYVGEHHFCDYVVSSPAVLLAFIAERTSRLRLGTGVSLLAHHDPVRIAEDYATLDVLSGGRVELVVGRGLLRRTYVDFGQDPDASREIFGEKLQLLTRLWSDRAVSWTGRHRSPLDTVTVAPRPLQRPYPPVWIAGAYVAGRDRQASLDRAARWDGLLPQVIDGDDRRGVASPGEPADGGMQPCACRRHVAAGEGPLAALPHELLLVVDADVDALGNNERGARQVDVHDTKLRRPDRWAVHLRQPRGGGRSHRQDVRDAWPWHALVDGGSRRVARTDRRREPDAARHQGNSAASRSLNAIHD